MRKYIQNICPKSITDAFTLQLNSSLTLFNGYKINLTDEEKLGGRTMAEGREGYARMVSRVAIQFPTALSRADNPLELSNLLDAYQNLEGNRLALLQALETIEEMQLGVASDIMVLVDRYVANLQISRSNEASLDGAMKDIDDWNKRFAPKGNSGSNA